MTDLLEFDNVQFSYPGANHPALQGISLCIPEGQRIALLGHNGCGKSTLFLHANGIYRPDSGRIKWKGTEIRYDRRSLAALRQSVGLVFQDPEQQLVASTVGEDISYGLCNAKLAEDEIRRRVEDVAVRFSLDKMLDRPVHQLSIGQKKRVSLAGVMALQPELLLLDEPTASLDRLHARELLRELEAIHSMGTTILMSTHDVELVYEWADWVLVLHQGTLAMEGTPDEVFAQRERLDELHLEVPLLLEMWDALPETIRSPFGGQPRPRTIAELRNRLARVQLQLV